MAAARQLHMVPTQHCWGAKPACAAGGAANLSPSRPDTYCCSLPFQRTNPSHCRAQPRQPPNSMHASIYRCKCCRCLAPANVIRVNPPHLQRRPRLRLIILPCTLRCLLLLLRVQLWLRRCCRVRAQSVAQLLRGGRGRGRGTLLPVWRRCCAVRCHRRATDAHPLVIDGGVLSAGWSRAASGWGLLWHASALPHPAPAPLGLLGNGLASRPGVLQGPGRACPQGCKRGSPTVGVERKPGHAKGLAPRRPSWLLQKASKWYCHPWPGGGGVALSEDTGY